MNKKLVIGTIGAIFIILLAGISNIVCAQTIKINKERTDVFQELKNRIEKSNWYPGFIIDLVFWFFTFLFFLFFPTPPPP